MTFTSTALRNPACLNRARFDPQVFGNFIFIFYVIFNEMAGVSIVFPFPTRDV